jgi:hypothetical protein
MVKPIFLLEPEIVEVRMKLNCSKKPPEDRNCLKCKYSRPEERCVYRVGKRLEVQNEKDN